MFWFCFRGSVHACVFLNQRMKEKTWRIGGGQDEFFLSGGTESGDDMGHARFGW